MKYEKCTDCHTDFHKGAFVKNSNIRDCSECHTVKGFKPSNYTIEQHNEIKFQLTGSHLAVSCESCHYKGNEWSFREIGTECISCHQNVHKIEITKKFMPDNNCGVCHETKSWLNITFDHSKTDYPLSGKHLEVNCGSCHYKNKTEFKFASLKSDCESCHRDVHLGQFKMNGTSDCQQCHGYHNWEPVKFDHNKTKFPLKGAHQKLNCNACHKQAENNGITFIKFKLEDFRCAACHY